MPKPIERATEKESPPTPETSETLLHGVEYTRFVKNVNLLAKIFFTIATA
jgi:hypothetical protein